MENILLVRENRNALRTLEVELLPRDGADLVEVDEMMLLADDDDAVEKGEADELDNEMEDRIALPLLLRLLLMLVVLLLLLLDLSCPTSWKGGIEIRDWSESMMGDEVIGDIRG